MLFLCDFNMKNVFTIKYYTSIWKSVYDGFRSIACFETVELSAGRDSSRDKTIHNCSLSLSPLDNTSDISIAEFLPHTNLLNYIEERNLYSLILPAYNNECKSS